MLSYLVLGGPFLVVALDVVITRRTRGRLDWWALLLALVGMLAVPLIWLRAATYPLWLILLPGVILLTYSGRMRGLGQFIAFFGWLMLCGLTIGQLAPKLPLAEAGFLPVNLGYWLIPLPLVWHLWQVLPLTYDALRGGDWVERGVPLGARYRFLSALVLVLFVVAGYFGWQWNEQRQVLVNSASAEIYSMWYGMKTADHWFSFPELRDSAHWEEVVAGHLRSYSQAASRITGYMRLHGLSADNPLLFLGMTIPRRFLEVVDYGLPLSEDEIAAHSALFKASMESLEVAVNSPQPLSLETYRAVVQRILQQLQGTDVLSRLGIETPVLAGAMH